MANNNWYLYLYDDFIYTQFTTLVWYTPYQSTSIEYEYPSNIWVWMVSLLYAKVNKIPNQM